MALEGLMTGLLSGVCFITGQVVWTPEETTAKLKAPCPIVITVTRGLIRMTSKRWLVDVSVPEEPGIQSFVYQWGQSEAQVGDHRIRVFYGPAGGV